MEKNFEYNNLPVRTLTDADEQVWFAGIDVCKILEYQNPTDIIEKKLDEDEKKLDYLLDSSGQRRKTWTINEFGLYSLILTSKKPEAKTFKRWVTHDVLPSIRKAGKYTSESEKEHELLLQEMVNEIEGLKEQKDTQQKKVNKLRSTIEEKYADMMAFIKRDRSQLQIPFETK